MDEIKTALQTVTMSRNSPMKVDLALKKVELIKIQLICIVFNL